MDKTNLKYASKSRVLKQIIRFKLDNVWINYSFQRFEKKLVTFKSLYYMHFSVIML